MKKFYLYFLISFFLASSPTWSVARQSDSQALLQKARTDLKNGQFDAAIGVALFGLRASENIQDQLMILRFKGVLGEAYIGKKDYKNAIRYFVEYTKTAEQNAYEEEYADGLYSLGSLYSNMMAYNKGADYYEQALSVFSREKSLQKMAKTAETLGEIYALLGNKEKELESYEVLRNLGVQMNDKKYALKSVKRLAELYVDNGNAKSALDHYRQVLSFNLTNDEKAEVNHELSKISLINGDKRRSLYYAKQATKYQPGEVAVNVQQGIAMLANNQLDEATNQFKLSLDLSKDLQDAGGMAESNNYLGKIQFQKKDYRQAQSYYNDAEKIGISNSLTEQLAHTYELLVELHTARNNRSLTTQYLQKGATVNGMLKDKTAVTAFSNSELRKAEEAAELLEQEILVEVAENERKRLALEQSRLLRASEEQRMNLLKQEQEIQKQQIEKERLEAEKTVLITKQELEAEQRRAELDRLAKEAELVEMENKRRLELAENEKLLLDQQTKLQAADIEKAEQAKRYLYIIVGIAFLTLLLLIYLLARISKTKRLIASQNEDLEKQQTQLKASQERLQNTLEEQVRAKNNLEKLNLQLKNTQSQLIHAEKMSSLGQLTAGIAHEVNNPVGFVKGGVQSLKISIDDMFNYLQQLSELDSNAPDLKESLARLQADYDEEKEEIHEICEQLVKDILFGATRIEEIVNGLRVFSRHEEAQKKFSDLHENLDSALLILRNKIKNKAEVTKDYQQGLEDIECFPGQLNQVFVNLVGNAVDAMDDFGNVVITTREEGDKVVISIKDDGKGIPPEIKNRIFEPFFTTKDVGEGTGLGLSISYSIIKEHGGSIIVESEVGKGTEFIITLQKVMGGQKQQEPETITQEPL